MVGWLLFLCVVIPACAVGFFGTCSFLAGHSSPAREGCLQGGDHPSQFTSLQILGGVLLLVLTFVCVAAPNRDRTFFLFLLAMLVLAWVAYTWINEFAYLMGLRDDDFPGRHDKLIWATAMLFFAPVGLWAFRAYRKARWPELKKSNQSAYHDVDLADLA